MTRKYPDHYYDQSSVVPCRLNNGQIEVLLITSSGKGRWGVPKGIIELELSPEESAAEEAYEEAGVKGEVLEPSVGSYRYEKWGGVCEVEVFTMLVDTVLDTWPESDVRRRMWVGGEQAAAQVARKQLSPLVEAAVQEAGVALGARQADSAG